MLQFININGKNIFKENTVARKENTVNQKEDRVNQPINFPELPTKLTAEYIHEFYVQKQKHERYSALANSIQFTFSNLFLLAIYLMLLIHPVSTFLNSDKAGACLYTILIFIICILGFVLSCLWYNHTQHYMMSDKNLQEILSKYQIDWSECAKKGNETGLSFMTTPIGNELPKKEEISNQIAKTVIKHKINLSKIFIWFWIVSTFISLFYVISVVLVIQQH